MNCKAFLLFEKKQASAAKAALATDEKQMTLQLLPFLDDSGLRDSIKLHIKTKKRAVL